MHNKNILYFTKIFLAIFVISFILDKITYFTLNKVSDSVYTGQGIGKLNHFLKIKDSKDLIVFGSSRANRHFEISELSANGYNIGMDGRKIAYPATLLKTLPKNKKQTIIFNVDIPYMLDPDYNGKDLDALYTKYNRNEIIRDNIDKYKQTNPFQKVFWCVGYNGYVVSILYNFIFKKYDYTKYDGYDANKISPSQQENLKKLIQKTPTEKCGKNLKVNKITVQIFKDISEFCKANNKTLIFVASPLYLDDCKEDDVLVANFMKENHYIYLDYTDFFKNNNSLTYWKDMRHLSGIGAHNFSKQLAIDLNQYLKK